MPYTEECDHTGNWVSPCSPRIKASMLWAPISSSCASRRRRRVVSSQTPVPSTTARQAGKLPYLPVMMSQGLVATRKMPLNPLAIIVGTMLFTIFAVEVSSSNRLWPGAAPARDGDHRDIDIGAVAGLAGGDGHHPRQVGRGVAQVLSVGLNALLVKVDEDQLSQMLWLSRA